MSAKFITLDGIDGSGKTTHLKTIRAWFEERQLPVCFTREPGGTPAGDALRSLLLDPQTRVNTRTETLLMFAARQQHLDDIVRPALEAGTHVVSDRFTDATFAYQGGGRKLPEQDIAMLESWVQQGLQPDLTFILDVPLEVSQERLNKNGNKDRFEQEGRNFFARTRDVYLQRARHRPERYAVIDSTRPLDAVSADIRAVLDKVIGR